MRPIVTPERMRRVDERAIACGTPLDVLVERAGWAVARAAREILGGTYGRRVLIVAGPGNNGADGRVAARVLGERGVSVRLIAADDLPPVLPDADLLIDAAYGTGFRGEWHPPAAPCPVLAVDVPTGVDGLTGVAQGSPWVCERTVTFVASKPGLHFHDGRRLSGRVDVVDIGIDVSDDDIVAGLVTRDDVASWSPQRAFDAHKWNHGALVVAGSPGMIGAATLASSAAMRTGAGIVHLVSPGVDSDHGTPIEVVRRVVDDSAWADDIVAMAPRFRVVAIGPGLGRDAATLAEARRVIARVAVPVVVDGDALHAIDPDTVSGRSAPTILTPHDGEFAAITGAPPGVDRIAAACELARRFGSVVLLKGPTTVVADSLGRVALVDHGDQRLATAGSGDVLAGSIAGAVAAGADPFEAAARSGWLCAEAGHRCPRHGTTASDLVRALPVVADELDSPTGQNDAS